MTHLWLLMALLTPQTAKLSDPYAGWTVHHLTDDEQKARAVCVPSLFSSLHDFGGDYNIDGEKDQSLNITMGSSKKWRRLVLAILKEDQKNKIPMSHVGSYDIAYEDCLQLDDPKTAPMAHASAAILPHNRSGLYTQVDVLVLGNVSQAKTTLDLVCRWFALHN